MSPPFAIRPAVAIDVDAIANLCFKLWPDAPVAEHHDHANAILCGPLPSSLPLTLFVAESAHAIVGFIEVGLRSHADGCDGMKPCGFIEGWYVEPDWRRRGIGGALVREAEAWCRAQGCTEMASDTWIDRDESQKAHAALGYEVVDRCVHLRKAL